MEPLVSVIITTYKGMDSIERAILSVVNQTYKNIEIIVVDDNGKNSLEQIETSNIVNKYPNVVYIAHDVNKNGSAARNTGARNSHGEFLAFLDDDDEYTSEKIYLQMKKFSDLSKDYALVYCSFQDIDDMSGAKETFVATKRGNILEYSLLDQVKVATSLFVVRREAFDKLNGFDESFRRHQDWEFVARLASKYKVDYVEEVCVIKHAEKRNSPRNIEKVEEFRMHYLNKLSNVISKLNNKKQKEVYCYHYLCFVKEYVKQKKWNKFIEYLIKSKAPVMFICMFLNNILKSALNKLKVEKNDRK